ncbi:MAG TPA: DinB family protein [Candidatus Nanoarchaeia archaeon]|nr:DinB family protein [Candidatus Nanoarchaeia archaeon]
MFTKDGLKLLHAETHQRYRMLLDHAESMPEEAFLAEVPGFGRGTLRDQLVHVLATEEFWVGAVQNKETVEPDYGSFRSAKGLRPMQQRVMSETIVYLDRVPEQELNRTLEQLPHDWVGAPASPAFILLHVITHAFHHKGQVVAMFRLHGHPIGDTDLQRE